MKYLNFQAQTSTILSVFLVAFLILFYWVSFDGYYFYDDLSYAAYAQALLDGNFTFGLHPFCHRLGLIIPQALVYFIFSVNDFSTTLLPLLSVLLTFFLITRILKHRPIVLSFALVLYILDYYSLFFSNKLYPDVLLAPLVLLLCDLLFRTYGMLRFWTYVRLGFRRYGRLHSPILIVLILFWAFLIKLSVIWLLPIFLWIFIRDLQKGDKNSFWFSFIVFSFVLGLFYLGFYKYNTGSYFYRLMAIEQSHYTWTGSYFDKSWAVLGARISYEPFLMLIESSLYIAFLPSFLGIVNDIRRWGFFKLPVEKSSIYFGLAAFLTFLAFIFGSTSFQVYNPMALQGRFLLPIVPLWAISGAYYLSGSLRQPRRFISLALGFLLAFLYMYFFKNNPVQWIYLLLFAFFTFTYLLPIKIFVWKWQFVIGLTLILLIHPSYVMLNGKTSGYQEEKSIFQTHIMKIEQPSTIWVDAKLAQGYPFYFSFNPPSYLIFQDFTGDTFQKYTKYASHYLLINQKNLEDLKSIGTKIPSEIEALGPDWELLVQQGEVSLYKFNRK